MKFTDGNWMMRSGVHAHYPAEAYEVVCTDEELLIHAPTKRINSRGDTLDGPLLTIRLSSPLEDIIRVQISHFSGLKDIKAKFPLLLNDKSVISWDNEDSVGIESGSLKAAVSSKNGWGLDFEANGKVITRSASRGIGYIRVDGEGTYVHEQLSLGVGELVYGLGERFTAFNKNGQVVEIWNKDGGTGSDQAYKNVPFYLTNKGYGVFINETGAVSLEVASEKVSRVQFSVPGQSLDYFLIYGPTPAEVLKKYTALTGRPSLPAAWSFGLWLTTSFTTPYDEATCTSFIKGMEERDLPLHVFHFDCFWMREFHWCDFKWDPRTFPDPPAMLQRLHERGLKISVWINPYIAQLSELFKEGVEGGYLLKNKDGSVWQTDQWQAGMGIVDFTNPAACEWYASKLRALVAMGVDSFKTDFGERIPTDVEWFDGSAGEGMHNFYPYLYNKTVFDVLSETRGSGEAVLFARSATAGGQQFPVHWGGDCYSSFESMAESLRGGLSLCLSGFGFWSHDIGGFEGTPPFEVYKRWIAFGLLSTHSRLHGSSSYRVPWLFDEEAVDTLRFFTRLKCSLMPTLFGGACEVVESGLPLMRAMMLEFPEDIACETLDRQYMLGSSLLVAPVFSDTGDVNYYLPSGKWTNFINGEVKQGPGWHHETHGFLSIPLMVRPGSIIAVGKNHSRPDYDFADAVTLQLYELEDGASAEISVPDLSGRPSLKARAKHENGTVTVKVESDYQNWSLLLVGIFKVDSVENGTEEQHERGVLLRPFAGSQEVIARLM